jgi:hypothetical protein
MASAVTSLEVGQVVRFVIAVDLFGGNVAVGAKGKVLDLWRENGRDFANVHLGGGKAICRLPVSHIEPALDAAPPEGPRAPEPAKRKGTLWD